ncbi:MAG: M18 family aminopeptidase [Coprobacillus sp.]
MYKQVAEDMMKFIKKSPTAFHVVENIKNQLLDDHYHELLESEKWHLEQGKKYFVIRNQSSIIAFKIGQRLDNYSFHVVASHSDSPTFKLKESAEIEVKNKYVQLNTEGYGGMICSSWLDRPLSIAGRVLIKNQNTFETKLFNIDKDLVLIPNVAIHMNRDVNDKMVYNKQVDMLPLFGGSQVKPGDLKTLIAKTLEVKEENIYGHDLYLYNRNSYSIWGLHDEFISCPQLDDLQCAYATLQGFMQGYHDETVQVYACFDNEEVGSSSKQGADSSLLYDVLQRIHNCLSLPVEDYYRAIASSFMVSADNAHAVHPNHPEKNDATNHVFMNEGIVIKSHAGQKYTSDAVSCALFKGICEKAEVPLQFFSNRSDMVGGSTLGNIASTHVSMNSVDIGLPQLAMHSSYETAGIKDSYNMIKAMITFFNAHIKQVKTGEYIIE